MKEGDTFLLRSGDIQERRATVIKILSKYHFRISDSTDGLEDRFPDTQAVVKINAYGEDGHRAVLRRPRPLGEEPEEDHCV